VSLQEPQEPRQLDEDETPVPLGPKSPPPEFVARLDRVYTQTQGELISLAKSVGADPGEALPLVHDAHVKALERWEGLALRDNDGLERWLAATVRKLASNWRRRAYHAAEVGGDPQALGALGAAPEPAPHERAELRERLAQAEEGLLRLTREQCEAFVCVDVWRMRYPDAAARLRLSERQLRRRLGEARSAFAGFQARRAGREECERIWPLLAEEDERLAPRERAAVRRHLDGCGECRADLGRVRRAQAGLAALLPAPVLASAMSGALSLGERVGSWATEQLVGLGHVVADQVKENPLPTLRRAARAAVVLVLVVFLAGVGTTAYLGAKVMGWPVPAFGDDPRPPASRAPAPKLTADRPATQGALLGPRTPARRAPKVYVSRHETVTRNGPPRGRVAETRASETSGARLASTGSRGPSSGPTSPTSAAAAPTSSPPAATYQPTPTSSSPSAAAPPGDGGSSAASGSGPAPLGSAEARRRAGAGDGP